MDHGFKASKEHLSYLSPWVVPAEKTHDGCEVCGVDPCDCPLPIAECCSCKSSIYDGDRWFTDSEGDRWCPECLPGGDS
jgi:hypothetical protein